MEGDSQMGWFIKLDLLVIKTTFVYLYLIVQIYYKGCINLNEKSPVMWIDLSYLIEYVTLSVEIYI